MISTTGYMATISSLGLLGTGYTANYASTDCTGTPHYRSDSRLPGTVLAARNGPTGTTNADRLVYIPKNATPVAFTRESSGTPQINGGTCTVSSLAITVYAASELDSPAAIATTGVGIGIGPHAPIVVNYVP
jgi:hypothetical protein